MAQKVIWTENAKNDLKIILDFWNEKNGSKKYSNFLLGKIREFEMFLTVFPKIGRSSKISNLRFCIVENNYSIYYLIRDSVSFIIHVWDNRRNPEDLKF